MVLASLPEWTGYGVLREKEVVQKTVEIREGRHEFPQQRGK